MAGMKDDGPEKGSALSPAPDRTSRPIPSEHDPDRYRKFFLLSADPMCIADPFGCFKHVNPAFMRLTGYEERELISRPFMDFILPEDRQRTADEMKLQVAVRPSMQFENRYVCKDGSVVWLSWMAYYDKQDGVTYASARNVTELRQAEQTLAASNEFSQSVIRSMQDGFSVLDVSGVALDANPAFCSMTGFSREELVGRRAPHPYWPPEEYERIQVAFDATLRGDVKNFELTFMRKSGERFPVVVSPFAVKNSRGETISFSATVKDVTASRQAEKELRERDEQHRSILQTSMSGFWMTDAQGRLLEVNDSYARMSGYSVQELLTMQISDLEAAETASETAAHIEKIMRQGEDRFESRHRRKDGSLFDVEISVQFRQVNGGRFVAFLRDITESKRAEATLRTSEERFRAIFEQAAVGVAMIDSNTGRFISVNQRTCDIARLTREQMMSSTFMDITHPDDLQADLDNMARLKSGAISTFTMEKRYLHPDGAITWVNLTVSPLWEPREKPTRHVAVVEDITARKQAEKALREANQKMRLHFDQTPMAVIEWDLNFCVTRWNPAAEAIFGFSSEEAAGRHAAFIIPEVYHQHVDGIWQALLKHSGGERSTNENVRKDGRMILCEWYNTPLIDECGVVTGVASLVQDVTVRKQAEEALRESHELFALFMRHSPFYIYIKAVTPTESRVLQASDNFEQMIGRKGPDMVGKTMEELFPAELAAKITTDDWNVVTSGKVLKIDEDFNGRNYTSIKFPISQDGRTLLAGYTIDITDLKQAQFEREQISRKMLEAQKLESLGVLAGGIAHDFNNLLTGIVGYASLIDVTLPRESPIRAHLDPIQKAAARAAHLCKQMLAYSGKGRFVVQRLDLGQLIEETTEMLKVSISKKVELRMQLERGLPPVEADATQIHQVVMNLVINASEAIGDRTGVINISNGRAHLRRRDFGDMYMASDLNEGDYVFLEVSDTGCGMDRETLSRIFDPFFTTKFTGRDLGLAAVLGIVRGHKAALSVTSEPGRGTTFRAWFPAAAGDTTARKQAGSRSDIEDWSASGTVLLVDDEETVRNSLTAMLSFFGLHVVCASDGREAVATFSTEPGRFALVLLDLTMPHMDGQQAYAELLRIRPDVRVVLMSGFSEKDAIDRFPGKRPDCFLQKPFKIEVMRDVLRGVFGQSR